MEGILQEGIGAYLDGLAAKGGEGLARVEAQGEKDGWPIVGAAEGGFLHLLARAIQAKRVLELGTAIGYSAAWFAMAVGPGGHVTTVEGNEKTAALARRNLATLGLGDRVEVRVGRAEAIVGSLRGPFDLAFLDVDKVGYPELLDPLARLVRVGGLLVADNVLWQGQVPRGGRTPEAVALREYNRRLAQDPRFLTAVLPLRDGVSVALKTVDG